MIRFSLLTAAFVVLALTACEGKKSLDGYPMDKPPPSAYAPRDSEPALDGADTKGTNTNEESSGSSK